MNRLKELREDTFLLQKDIEKKLNIVRRTYSHYENESLDIPSNVLCTLADFYNVSIDYLLYHTDERTPHKIIKRYNKNCLKDIRKNSNLTQINVSKDLSISQNGLSQYETFTNDIPTLMLKKFSNYYNVSIDYILCRTNESSKYKESFFKNH